MSQPASPLRLDRLSRTRTRRRKETPRWSILLSTGTLAALLALAILNPWMTDETHGAYGGVRSAGYALLTLLTVAAAEPWKHPERLLVVPWPILVALGWCWLSLLWAVEPLVGLRRLALTTAVAWSLFALVRQLGPERAIAIVRVLLVVTLVANYAVVLIDPATGIHPKISTDFQLEGKWRGLMDHKNFAGLVCALTILAFAFDGAKIPVAVRVGVAAAAAVFLFFTDSATSLGMCVAGLLFGGAFVLASMRQGPRQPVQPAWALILLGIFAFIFASMAINPLPYLDMLSDPAGFTGRTQIWSTLIRAYVDRPLFGIGYGSFWDLGPAGPVHSYARNWVAEMSEGHNGYLDMLVQIGAVGTLLVIFAALVWPIQRLLRGGDHPARPLAAAILLFCIGHNFTESMLFDRDQLAQVFMMIAIAILWIVTAAGDTPAARPKRVQPTRTRARKPLRLTPEG